MDLDEVTVSSMTTVTVSLPDILPRHTLNGAAVAKAALEKRKLEPELAKWVAIVQGIASNDIVIERDVPTGIDDASVVASMSSACSCLNIPRATTTSVVGGPNNVIYPFQDLKRLLILVDFNPQWRQTHKRC
jgi:hypothetical protein